MNDLNLQNPEFLFYVNRVKIRYAKVSVVVQIESEVLVLMTKNYILDNYQIWNGAHLESDELVSFTDLWKFFFELQKIRNIHE